MFAVYVLRSLKTSKRYVGFTSKDVSIRLVEHNSGCNKWTRQNKPFEVIHTEEFANKRDAIVRERFLKSGQGRKLLDQILKI